MAHPYAQLDPTAFWKPAVAERHGVALDGVWRPKWRLEPSYRVVTFGSCFASHLGPALRRRGFTWWETEPAPRGLSAENAKRFGYGRFSCRTGNLYTASLLLQWVRWALGEARPPEEPWGLGDRVVDPFRPVIEPGGFASLDEMLASRHQALRSFRRAIEEADVFLFTLGLTESWVHQPGGWEYPSCPGTVAGEHDPAHHHFVNLSFVEVHGTLVEAIERMESAHAGLRFLLTVSPVPLTATHSGAHVLVATTESKSILRAVAGQLATRRSNVDYFPAYELISAPTFRGAFFEANQRSVSARGVAFVTDTFFAAHGVDSSQPSAVAPAPSETVEEDPQCEEAWLEGFRP